MSVLAINPRLHEQFAIEKRLQEFRPDYNEACELLDALIAALEKKVGCERMMVVEEEARALKVAIREAEPCELSAEDLAYDARVQKELDAPH